MEQEATITKMVNGVQVTAKIAPNGMWRFFCGPRGRDGQALWNSHSQEWVKVHSEVGWRFKAHIKATFKL